ncbi:unnamed protein product [Soboliphyme baturini]|uniref:Uncharacterized protein n=1 Tax=Soboliphyme baturini TaxID=241478 RepID=A0A183IL69_9BILA|nr:unnamed protein product [Soboliphyme baturini]
MERETLRLQAEKARHSNARKPVVNSSSVSRRCAKPIFGPPIKLNKGVVLIFAHYLASEKSTPFDQFLGSVLL